MLLSQIIGKSGPSRFFRADNDNVEFILLFYWWRVFHFESLLSLLLQLDLELSFLIGQLIPSFRDFFLSLLWFSIFGSWRLFLSFFLVFRRWLV